MRVLVTVIAAALAGCSGTSAGPTGSGPGCIGQKGCACDHVGACETGLVCSENLCVTSEIDPTNEDPVGEDPVNEDPTNTDPNEDPVTDPPNEDPNEDPVTDPPNECTPSCGDAECGPNGCGGSCGTCGSNEVCTSGSCVATCQDNDDDGYGDGCSKGPDCDDSDASVHPGAEEICGNGKDDDCKNGEPECCPNTSKVCIDGDSYWMDSCGTPGGLAEKCGPDTVCAYSNPNAGCVQATCDSIYDEIVEAATQAKAFAKECDWDGDCVMAYWGFGVCPKVVGGLGSSGGNESPGSWTEAAIAAIGDAEDVLYQKYCEDTIWFDECVEESPFGPPSGACAKSVAVCEDGECKSELAP